MAPETLLIATRSADKLKEIREILARTALKPISLQSLADLNIATSPAEDDIENFDTFLENAIAKARYFAQLTGIRTLADDSGIVVDALGGAPGVRTKRFALDHGYVPEGTSGKALDQANNRLLLERLRDIEGTERCAHYVCAAAYCDGEHVVTVVGTVDGTIAREEKGTGGFGYDPLFCMETRGITFAELSRDEKNSCSHRALAVRALAPHLK